MSNKQVKSLIQKIPRFLAQIHLIFRKDCRFYILTLLLNTPSVLLHILSSPKNGVEAVKECTYYMSLCAITDCIIRLVRWHRLRRCARGITVVILSLFFLIDIFMLLSYGCLPDKAAVSIVLDTNTNEANDFFRSFVLDLCFIRKFVLVVIALAISYHILSLTLWNRLSFSVLALVMLWAFIHNYRKYPFLSVERFWKLFIDAYKELSRHAEIKQKLNTHLVTLLENNQSIPYFCFILGESHSRNRMSLYGYNLTTTPLLEKRARKQELFVFDDVICPLASTFESIKLMFTFCRYKDSKPWYSYQNLFRILEKAQYHSVWLSNQEFTSFELSPSRLFAETCSEHHYTMIRDSVSYKFSRLDEAVLPLLDKTLKNRRKPLFHLIHLYGAHFQYADRYPDSFSKFSPDDELTGLKLSMRQTQAHYDNVMLYDDYVIDSIIKRYENRDAVVLFISDHGEDVYENKTKLRWGHDSWARSDYMVEVPMLLWISASLKEKRPDLVQRVKQSTTRPFMTDDTIYVIMDLLGIKTPEFIPRRSIIHQDFDSSRIRYGNRKPYIRRKK